MESRLKLSCYNPVYEPYPANQLGHSFLLHVIAGSIPCDDAIFTQGSRLLRQRTPRNDNQAEGLFPTDIRFARFWRTHPIFLRTGIGRTNCQPNRAG